MKYRKHTIVKTNLLYEKKFQNQAYKKRQVNLYRILGEFAKGPKEPPLLTTIAEAKLYIRTMKNIIEFDHKQ